MAMAPACLVADDSRQSTDMLVETLDLPIKDLPPDYEPHCGWRLMTGNVTHNKWARVVYRYELEDKE